MRKTITSVNNKVNFVNINSVVATNLINIKTESVDILNKGILKCATLNVRALKYKSNVITDF